MLHSYKRVRINAQRSEGLWPLVGFCVSLAQLRWKVKVKTLRWKLFFFFLTDTWLLGGCLRCFGQINVQIVTSNIKGPQVEQVVEHLLGVGSPRVPSLLLRRRERKEANGRNSSERILKLKSIEVSFKTWQIILLFLIEGITNGGLSDQSLCLQRSQATALLSLCLRHDL